MTPPRAPASIRIAPEALPVAGLEAARQGTDLDHLARLAAGCQACDLWQRATQTVFGEGSMRARVVLVGEQPGDREDRAGHPFVGPAGGVLDAALDAAGINREEVFITNVVKHFKWRPALGGKRRLHERPNASEVRACRPWLEAELELLKPETLVLLGATAAQAMLGPSVRVSQTAGKAIASDLAPRVVATIHPSAVLRARDEEERVALRERLVSDLTLAAAPVRRTVPERRSA